MAEPTDWDMKIRLASYRMLEIFARRGDLPRQAKGVIWASAALAAAIIVTPELIDPDWVKLGALLNIDAVKSLIKRVAAGEKSGEAEIVAEMTAIMPAAEQLDQLVTGQKDLLRILTHQREWQRQMTSLQKADAAAWTELVAGFAEITGNLVELRDLLAAAATAEQAQEIIRLITDEVLPRLTAMPQGDRSVSFTPDPLPPPADLSAPGPLPPRSRLPYQRNPLFTGREGDLRQLARQLLHEPDGTPTVISTGIGGIGKTQLAIEFAWRYGRYLAGGVQWFSMADESREALEAEAAACGLAMGLWPEAADSSLSREEKAARLRRAWAGPEPRLIIFDNCESRAVLEAWRPGGGGARVLVTSRDSTWPAGYSRLPVRTLPRHESIALLHEYLQRERRTEPDAALDAVAAELDDLPLALTLAGSVLAAYPSLPVDRYLQELRAPGLLERLLDEDARPVSGTGHDPDVARTFAVSFNRLMPDESETDAAARTMLAGATCLVHGDPFPRALMAGMLPDDDDPRPADRAVNRLLALGLLERAEAADLRLHRLIGRFVEGAVAREVMDGAREGVERAVISLAYKQNMAGDPRRLREWETHLRHVTDAAFGREDNTAATLCANLGYYLQMSGELAPARPYFERALAISERVLGPEHPQTASVVNNMGALLDSMGELAAARPYYERALAVRERVLGPEHPDTALSLNNLGTLLWAMGESAAARPYFERALAILERVLGPEHPDTARSLNNLGGLLKTMGELAAARPYYERALAILERVLGLEHPDTASSINNMGALLDSMGELAMAKPYYERALAIRERVLGPEHPDTAASLNNIAILCYYEGDFQRAADYMRRALAIWEKALGPNHPNTVSSRNSLAAIEARLRDA